jgi:HEAT repeat protein/predicted MPP superfamily phosphohydrolase
MDSRIVRILHISDIHRGPDEPTSTASLLGRLLTDIRRTYEENNQTFVGDEPRLGQPDIIVVSGDLTQRAAVEEFKEARKFLEGLLPLVKGHRDRIVLVPGNHDLDWGIAARSFTQTTSEAFKSQKVYFSPYRQGIKRSADATFWAKDEATYTERFRPFKEFFDSFYEGRLEYALERNRMFSVYDLREPFGIVVAGFNSCDEIDAYRGDDGGLHLLGNRASINTDAIYAAVNTPVFSNLKGALLVAAFHHNIRSVEHGEDFLDPRYVQELRQQGFELCLHGHVHDANNDSFFDQIQDGRVPVVGAGSLAAPYQDRPPAVPQGYNLIVIDRESGGIWVHTRRSDERHPVWTPNFQWNGKPYFEARAPRQVLPESPPPVPPGPGDNDHPESSARDTKGRGSIFKRLKRKGRGIAELREAHRRLLLGAVSPVRLFGSDEPRDLREVFVKLAVVEEYLGLPGDSQLMGMLDAGLRRRLSIFARGSLEADGIFLSTDRGATVRTISPDDLLRVGRHSAVTGAPGCGKTTLLKYLALQTTLKEPDRWVVFLELKTVSAKDLMAATGLPDLLFNKAAAEWRLSEDESKVLRTDFFNQLRAGNASLYLDGLDEVRHQSIFGDLCVAVSEFALDEDFKGNTLILSARPFALHRAQLDGLQRMEIQPLDPKQIKAFLQSYYPSDEAVRRLAGDLEKPGDLREMARVPVMLAAIVELYRGGEALGNTTSRLEIYEKIVRRLVVKLDQEKNTHRFYFRLDDPEGTLKLDFLQRLAFERLLMDENDSGTEASRFIFGAEDLLDKAKAFVQDEGLRDVAAHTLADDVKATPLLREVSENKYAFAHTTLQEYMAAKVLARRADRVEIFCRAYFNPALVAQEALPMALGLSARADELYEELERLPESLTFTSLRLRTRGLCYAADISQSRFNNLLDHVARILLNPWHEDAEPYRRVILRSLWFLSERARDYLEEKIIPHLSKTSGFANLNAAEALTVLGSEKSFEPLVGALNPQPSRGIFSSRIIGRSALDDSLVHHVCRALIKIDPEKAVPVLASIPTSYSYGEIDRLLKQIGTEEAFKALLARGKGLDWLSSHASKDLVSRSNTESVTGMLIGALRDPRDGIRGMAVEALGNIGVEEAAVPVAACLRDPHFTVRWKAARALGMIGSKDAIGPLVEALRDMDSTVRWCAADALERIGSETSVEGLINALNDSDPEVRYHVATALGWLGSERAVEPLIKVLTGGGNTKPRRAAAYAFYRLKSRRAIGPLIQCLTDTDHEVRAGAAYALGNIRAKEALQPLLERLSDESPDVREGAAFALGQIGSPEAVPHLIRILHAGLSGQALESVLQALGAIGSMEAVESLVEFHARSVHYAAEAMSQVDAKILASALPGTLRHDNERVRAQAARIVGYYCNGPSIFNELARLAESDPSAMVRAAASEALPRYERKLELYSHE